MNRLHVAQPKKRDNVVRDIQIPESVLSGVKKQGPTVKEQQEEFGGAGNFYIPVEEHYRLEDEDWKYDRWPEFYLGKNVADFYDPDIEEKLAKLELEEENILQMEANEQELNDDSMSEDESVTEDDLKKALKEVRGKKTILKMQHKLKRNLRARSKNKNLKDMEEFLESKGINVNKESLRARVKQRKSITQLEDNQEKFAKMVLAEDASDAEEVEDSKRGRKRQRS